MNVKFDFRTLENIESDTHIDFSKKLMSAIMDFKVNVKFEFSISENIGNDIHIDAVCCGNGRGEVARKGRNLK